MRMLDGYTGKLFEEEIGHCLASWEKTGYLSYEESIKLVKKSQPWNDPSDPGCRLANDFHSCVAKALDLDDLSELKFYTAVSSSLDRYHGIDCLFEFRGFVVTVDVTIDHDKEESKADALVNFGDYIENRQDYLEVIKQAGEKIAEQFCCKAYH